MGTTLPTVVREGKSWDWNVEKRQPCGNLKTKHFQKKTCEWRILKLRTSLVCFHSRREGPSGWREVNKGKDGGRQVEEKGGALM